MDNTSSIKKEKIDHMQIVFIAEIKAAYENLAILLHLLKKDVM